MSHFGLITAGDVQAEQARTASSAEVTDAAVSASPSVDAATKSEWATFYAGLHAWCVTPIVNFWAPWNPSGAVVVTGDTGDTMMAWEAQLAAWQARLAPMLAAAAPPGLEPFDPAPAGGTPAPSWLKWGVAGVAGVAAIYVAAELAPVFGLLKRRN